MESESGWRINVSKVGPTGSYHWFDLFCSRSRYPANHIVELVNDLKAKLPLPEYLVEVSRVTVEIETEDF